jgi:hypothetical protein
VSLGPQGKATDVEWDIPLTPEADYVPLGVFLTRVPDVLYPWPAWQVRIIREFDPGFIPIMRKKVYRSRAHGICVFYHHGIARWDPRQRGDVGVLRAPVPQAGYGSSFGPANVIDRWFEDINHVRPGTKRFANNLPPPFIPWTDAILRWLRECHWEASTKEKREFVERLEEEKKEKAQKEAAEEAAYIQKNEFAYQQRLYDQLSVDDEKEFRARSMGQHKEDKNPFVDHGRRGIA